MKTAHLLVIMAAMLIAVGPALARSDRKRGDSDYKMRTPPSPAIATSPIVTTTKTPSPASPTSFPTKSPPKTDSYKGPQSGSYKGESCESPILRTPVDLSVAWDVDTLVISWPKNAYYGAIKYTVKCVAGDNVNGCTGTSVGTVTYSWDRKSYGGDDDDRKGRSGSYSADPNNYAYVDNVPDGASCYLMASTSCRCSACFALTVAPPPPQGCWATTQADSDPNCATEAAAAGWKNYFCSKDLNNAADLGTCMRKYVLAGYGPSLLTGNGIWNWNSGGAFSSAWAAAINLANFGPAGIVNDRVIEAVTWNTVPTAADYAAVDGVMAIWNNLANYAPLIDGLKTAFLAGEVDVVSTEDAYSRPEVDGQYGDVVSRALLGEATSTLVPNCGTCGLRVDGTACVDTVYFTGANINLIAGTPASSGPFGTTTFVEYAYATTMFDPALVTAKGGVVIAEAAGDVSCQVSAGGANGAHVAFFPAGSLGATAGRFIWSSDSEFFSNDYFANNGVFVKNALAWLSDLP